MPGRPTSPARSPNRRRGRRPAIGDRHPHLRPHHVPGHPPHPHGLEQLGPRDRLASATSSRRRKFAGLRPASYLVSKLFFLSAPRPRPVGLDGRLRRVLRSRPFPATSISTHRLPRPRQRRHDRHLPRHLRPHAHRRAGLPAQRLPRRLPAPALRRRPRPPGHRGFTRPFISAYWAWGGILSDINATELRPGHHRRHHRQGHARSFSVPHKHVRSSASRSSSVSSSPTSARSATSGISRRTWRRYITVEITLNPR